MSFDLFVDTSRKGISIAVAAARSNAAGSTPDGCDEAFYKEIVDPEARGETLSKNLDCLLEQGGISLQDIKRVMVTLGPGSFSGLRTGVAFCQGICFSGMRKLYGVSTLEALECFAESQTADSAATSQTAVVVKARKDYWYLRLCGQESFDSTEDVLAKLGTSQPKFAVVDATAGDDARLTEFFSGHGIKTVLDEGNPLSLWAKLFENHEPSLIQEANYIQPSYFEKGH